MPWEVVETHEGYQVVKAPALGEQPPKYFAQFSCSTVHRTPFRLTLEQAAGEGKIVSDQIKRRHEQDAAVSWKAQAAPNNPSAATGSTAQQCGFVSLGTCYHGGLPRRCIQLGQCLGSGGFADVFKGTVLALGGMQISSAQQYQQVMAAAAEQPGSVSVAVKVFRSSSSSAKTETLQKCAARELEALRHLQFKTQAVQLLAEGQPVPPPTTSIASQPDGSMPSPGCSKRKRAAKGALQRA
ncbi:hypothetical protein OEZ86_006298 [Tetradesmus obliquus]|nr:hypothetical protein OEZ86_006298 [Tetradesmus obliquus]